MLYQNEVVRFCSKSAVLFALRDAKQTEKLRRMNGEKAHLQTVFMEFADITEGASGREGQWSSKVVFALSENELIQFGQWLLGRFKGQIEIGPHHGKILYLESNLESGTFGVRLANGKRSDGGVVHSVYLPQTVVFRVMPLVLRALSSLTLLSTQEVLIMLRGMPLASR
ncbi:hypothetical protein AB4571_02305 [Vibrio breoganii]|uniref:hypothetical protein n=1 Tax=Vibrio breoganii TaxID=553239 RepID=UPI000C85C9F7|nr:hypothetical protein [Vibrio breoganii]PML12746.1 hypothetical protein BCT84_02355 [Vibrio breoganii]